MRMGAGGERPKFTILSGPIPRPSPPLLFIPGLLEFSKPLRRLPSAPPLLPLPSPPLPPPPRFYYPCHSSFPGLHQVLTLEWLVNWIKKLEIIKGKSRSGSLVPLVIGFPIANKWAGCHEGPEIGNEKTKERRPVLLPAEWTLVPRPQWPGWPGLPPDGHRCRPLSLTPLPM